MGVKVDLREYSNGYRVEKTDWLLGGVGDWQSLVIEVDFAVEKRFNQSSQMLVDNENISTTDGTDWAEFGFDVGDNITIDFRFTVYDANGDIAVGFPVDITLNRNITLLAGDTMTLDSGGIGGDYTMFPYQDAQVKLDHFIVWADKQPQGVEIAYGHLKNSDVDGVSLASFIDGTYTRMIAINTDTLTGFVPMEMIGNQSGMSVLNATWKFYFKEGTHTYKYVFIIEYMISSFFEELSNFELMTAPSQLFDIASLTDNFQIIGYPEWNNPNTQIKNDMQDTKRLGNTGWFGENYNGLENDFEVISVTYVDINTGISVNKLSYVSDVRVKAVVSGVQNLANGLTQSGLGFIWLPEDEEFYKELDTPFHQNLKVNTAGGLNSGVFVNSTFPSATIYAGYSNDSNVKMSVKDVHFYESGGNLVYEATFVPSAGMQSFIEGMTDDNWNYALWISVADRTLETNFSNRVPLLIDYNKLEKYLPPVGAYQNLSIGFLEHPSDFDDVVSDCGLDMYIEDDILVKIPFTLDLDYFIPQSVEFVIEVENNATGQKYTLQSYNVDLSTFPLDGNGVPQFNYDDERGFKLESGNNKNWVKVQREPNADAGGDYGYVAYYGFKIRWEDWLKRTAVPNDFYDNNKDNNGFNNDWSDYITNTDWKMNFSFYMTGDLDGSLVRFENKKAFSFNDYDSSVDVDSEWDFIRESDGSLLNAGIDVTTGKPLGVLLDGEMVRIRIKHRKTSGVWTSLTNIYGVNCIEVDKGAGQFEFRQLSSIWGSEAGNPLKPVSGQIKLKLTLIDPTHIWAECLVDSSLLIDAVRYKCTGRLGCKIIV